MGLHRHMRNSMLSYDCMVYIRNYIWLVYFNQDFCRLYGNAIIGGILLICNEDMQLAGTVVNLYVRFDNITIEDMSQYFKIDNMTAANEGIYADITPIAEYSMEIKHALNSMGVI